MTQQKIAIIGAGGFAREVLCLLIDMWSGTDIDYRESVCFVDREVHSHASQINDVPVILESDFDTEKYHAVIGVGDPQIRSTIVDRLPANTKYATVIHPSAVVSKWVDIGEGGVICAGTILT